MKATGIVRRIDDLGRVVIPKDIRNTIRWREGDPIEIFVDREGEVILKKYSPIGELGDFAKEYVDSLYETIGQISIITDRDIVIAVAGANKKGFVGKTVGKAVEKVFYDRETWSYHDITEKDNDKLHIIQMDGKDYDIKSQVIAPILCQGDPIGAVIIITKDSNVNFGNLEIKLAETAANFLAKQMKD